MELAAARDAERAQLAHVRTKEVSRSTCCYDAHLDEVFGANPPDNICRIKWAKLAAACAAKRNVELAAARDAERAQLAHLRTKEVSRSTCCYDAQVDEVVGDDVPDNFC